MIKAAPHNLSKTNPIKSLSTQLHNSDITKTLSFPIINLKI